MTYRVIGSNFSQDGEGWWLIATELTIPPGGTKYYVLKCLATFTEKPQSLSEKAKRDEG